MRHTPLSDPPTLEGQLNSWATWYRRYQHSARGMLPSADDASARASVQEAYEQWNAVCDWFEARGIPDDVIVYDEETETCQLRSGPAERAEIEVHIAADSLWYQRYDAIVTGRLAFPDPTAHNRAEKEASDHC